MAKFEISDSEAGNKVLKTSLRGKDLLASPVLNKGNAFSLEERIDFGLLGLLPNAEETLDQQVQRHYKQYCGFQTDLEKNIYLNVLLNNNETLFFKLLSANLEEMLPIVYTPTVGLAVEEFSLQFRRERGLYVSYPHRQNMVALLGGDVNTDIDLMVITDGGAVLGIGDQGLGGMAISVGKMIVYAMCAGIDPQRILPVQLDVGTDNEMLLADGTYLGWHHKRVHGKAYDDFVDHFVREAQRLYPNAILHWEDFQREDASRILKRYQDNICSFNDDMQGTGAVTLACVYAALHRGQLGSLVDQRFVIHGAGAAAIGIADQLIDAIVAEGSSLEDAKAQFWLLNREGLLTEQSASLNVEQARYARPLSDLEDWDSWESLLKVVENAQPTILIGCSTATGAFDQPVVQAMAKNTPVPVILPLSNPSSKSEAVPQDLYNWTDGKALVAMGSPFDDVTWQEQSYPVAQCNNAFIYPGLSFGLVVSRAEKLTSNVLIAASKALAAYAIEDDAKSSRLLPPLSYFPAYSAKIALAVAEAVRAEGHARVADSVDFAESIAQQFWQPEYLDYHFDPAVA